MESFPEPNALEEEQEVSKSERQQSKIIKIIENGDLDVLEQPPTKISNDERDSFLKQVQEGTVTEETLDSNVIRNIAAPFSGEEGVRGLYEKLQMDLRLLDYVGDAIKEGLFDHDMRILQDWRPTAEELGRFVEKYPTPLAFDKAFITDQLERIQAQLETTTNPQSQELLKKSISLLQQREKRRYPRMREVLYGKRNEYWEQGKLLLKEAREDDEATESVEVKTTQEERITSSPRFVEQPVAKEQEGPAQPETTQFLQSLVIDEDLAYQDLALPVEAKKQMLDWSRQSESAQKYAGSIVELSQRASLEAVRDIAKELVRKMAEEASRLGIPVSPYGKSNTWAMWDMGKQNYFFTHQTENNQKYEIGDPLASEEKREEIINRHLGWEAYTAFRSNATQEWKQRIANDRRFVRALDLLNKEPKPNSSLSSKDLEELGKILREVK